MEDKYKAVINAAIVVARNRNGDIDTEDGTFATTETDAMICLEEAIGKAFECESSSTTILAVKLAAL